MIIKYFDDYNGVWLDITGNTGSTLTKGANEWTTSQGYSVLTLLISQTGINDPTCTELENTITAGYTLSRITDGDYDIDFDDSILSQGKTFLQIQSNEKDILVYRDSDTKIKIGTPADDKLYFTSFELRIYN